MKAIIASLMVAVSLPAYAQEAPVDLLKKPVSFDGVDIEISEIFEIVGMNIKPSLNVVFKGTAGQQKVNRLRVKDVSLGSLFKVIESVAEVEIEVIDERGAAGGPADDPFGGAPPIRRLSSSGVIIVSSKNPPKKPAPGVVPAYITKPKPSQPKPSKVETEVISLAELRISEEALIDAIKVTWHAVDPNLENRASISFHEPSKLLIISGPQEAIENAQKTVGALLPSYRELIQTKAKTQAAYYQVTPQPKSAGSIPNNVPSVRKLFVNPDAKLKAAPNSYRPAPSELVPVPSKPRRSNLKESPRLELFEKPSAPARPLDLEPAPKPSLPRR